MRHKKPSSSSETTTLANLIPDYAIGQTPSLVHSGTAHQPRENALA